jgi:hypothetical protein
MKNCIFSVILLLNMLPLSVLSQTDSDPVALGLPGDNLNLYAVLEVFQKSPTLEEFEKSLNDKETKINNLDLNNDKLVDYISVINLKNGLSHSIVLRVAINDKENQDVAVIEVSKDKNDKVAIQIIGDEDLYGKNYIIEPSKNKAISGTPNPGYIENDNDVYYVNDWPVVVYLFSPVYVVYTSPWYWGYYPSYWHPWTPVYYYDYWGFHSHYYHNHFYRRLSYVRYPIHYREYSRVRNSSTRVIRNRRDGIYDATYNGRVYSRPIVPVTRRSSPTNREMNPVTRSNTRRTTSPQNDTRRNSNSSTDRRSNGRG